MVPVWFLGNNLPSESEYDSHIENKFCEGELKDDLDTSDISDSENDYDSDKFAPSQT